jgi:hypothetical protein
MWAQPGASSVACVLSHAAQCSLRVVRCVLHAACCPLRAAGRIILPHDCRLLLCVPTAWSPRGRRRIVVWKDVAKDVAKPVSSASAALLESAYSENEARELQAFY